MRGRTLPSWVASLALLAVAGGGPGACVVTEERCELAVTAEILDVPPDKTVRYSLALYAWTEWEFEDGQDTEVETHCEVLDQVWVDHPGTVELAGGAPCNASSSFHLSTFRDDDSDGEFYEGTSAVPSEPYCVRELGGVAGWDEPLEVWLHTDDHRWNHTCAGHP